MDALPSDTVLVHLYRGELSRLVAYRSRLDTTTNWAIGLSAAMSTFTLGAPDIPHAVMLFAIALDLLLLWVEARRYRAYQLSHHRVRLLERGMIGAPPAEWWDTVRTSLADPSPPLGVVGALCRRLRRNYLWLVGSLFVAWAFKIHLHEGPDLVQGARIGPLPGEVVLSGATLTLLALALAALSASEEPIEG